MCRIVCVQHWAWVAIFLLNIMTFSIATGNQDLRKSSEGDRQSRSEDDYHGVMWFGPRLGKRSGRLGGEDRQTWHRLLEAAEAVKFYYSQLQQEDPEMSMLIPKISRSLEESKKAYLGNVDFTPRLGRTVSNNGEYARVTPSDQQNYRSEEQLEVRPPLFSPRLGRTVHFSPRLGRELYYEMATPEEESVRVARSVTQQNKPTNST